MGVHRRDNQRRIPAGGKPRVRIERGEDGAVRVEFEDPIAPVHPETIAEERPPQADDPRPVFWQNAGGPWSGA